ncbi:hypothetical protein NUW58_g1356 [Xylaria curta]|uniref:Uncharacterized protein n=1 Tax=Xylaria curta TaxID=42375 RepID=A0ACC1PKR0_9PEZI|nr:hypothetical protein NUW58_g1356 [Xylaria curta]
MAESHHGLSSSGQMTDPPGACSLSITSANESNGSSHSSTLTRDPLSEDGRTSESTQPIEKQSHNEIRVESTPRGFNDHRSVGVFPHLQKAIDSTGIETLSRHQSTGELILKDLLRILSSNTNYTETSQISAVKRLQESISNPRTILGVVGGTGHGKSSLINTLLGEDQLVPTNCFRACTAVVTEISYNVSEDPDHRYVAEIEFISVEDWDRELGYLFHDLVSSSGEVSGEGQFEASDAGVAWAKIKAVYPSLNKQAIGKMDAKELTDNPVVKSVLGTTKTVHKPTADELHEAIQIYVDSKKKMGFDPSDGGEKDSPRKIELWPLIKVVRIFTKADVLSSGAVIVDLPGVQDSNAARAAVAGKYIEKCNGLWVVSIITRAVDDQAAQELLGARFKQQIKLDGNYSNLTFVCSKTDDINVREAARDLGLSEDVQKLKFAKQVFSRAEASSDLKKLGKREYAIWAYTEEVDKHIERYEKLKTRQANGKKVTPPKELPGKRKNRATNAKSSKRRKVGLDEGSQETQWVSTEDRWGDLERGMPKFPAEHHLTQEDIQTMIDFLRSQKQAAIDEKESLHDKVYEEEDRLAELEEQVAKLEERLQLECVSRRNECARKTIRDQFALGLRELDQQESQRADPNNFDPENEYRDYAEVARSLPVFCVSSQAYRSLANEEQVHGFDNMDDTEIPQLRAHTIMLTEASRVSASKWFLNDLAQTLNSLYLWSSETNVELHLTDDEKKAEMGFVREQIDELDKRLLKANEDLSHQLNDVLEALFRCLDAAALHAADCAPDICHHWPSYKRGDGGLHYMTYKATIRRDGAFSGKNGPRNFNEDLAAPILLQLGNDWEKTFTVKIPELLDVHAKACQFHQEDIQGTIKSHLQERTAFGCIIGMLQDQDRARVTGLANTINSLITGVTASQRDANRGFTSAIQKRLTPIYQELSEDSGPGVFARLKLGMETEITEHGRSILKGSCESPTARLSEIPGDIKHKLLAYIGAMKDRMISDYSNVILGINNSESKLIRQEVFELLKEADKAFE